MSVAWTLIGHDRAFNQSILWQGENYITGLVMLDH